MHQVQSLTDPLVAMNFPMGHEAHTVTPVAALYRPGPHAVQVEKPVDDVYPPEAHPVHPAEEMLPAMVV